MLLPSPLTTICCHQLFNKPQHGLCSSRSCRSRQATGRVSLHVQFTPALPEAHSTQRSYFYGRQQDLGLVISISVLCCWQPVFPAWKGANSSRCSEHMQGEWAMALIAQLRKSMMDTDGFVENSSMARSFVFWSLWRLWHKIFQPTPVLFYPGSFLCQKGPSEPVQDLHESSPKSCNEWLWSSVFCWAGRSRQQVVHCR